MLEKYATGEIRLMTSEGNNIGEYEAAVRDVALTLASTHREAYDKGRFPFIGFPTDQLIVLLNQAAQIFESQHGVYPSSFMDLGCGIGNTLIVAKQLGYDVSGVEVNEDYLIIAQSLLPNDKIEYGDLWTWTPEKRADIVFMYKPFHNEDLWAKFMRRFVDEMFPKGQLIISALSMHMFTYDTSPYFIPELVELSPSIYQIRRER